MGYSIFRFGALYLSCEEQAVPRNPTTTGDIPEYYSAIIGFLHAISGPPITWIKPDGLNLLIADRVLLNCVSWTTLNENGFASGKQMIYDNQRFRCRLPQLGPDEDTPCEWTDVLSVAGAENSIWHWTDMYFWGSDAVPWRKSATRAICGGTGIGRGSACRWDYAKESEISEDVGFRPVLEPLGAVSAAPNCKLDGADFHLSGLPGDGFCPILQPVRSDVFADILDGQRLKMYTFMENGRPIQMDRPIKDTSKLVLTDRYYGDEYLVPWTISNGVAVASQSLLQQDKG